MLWLPVSRGRVSIPEKSVKFIIIPEVGDLVGMIKMGIMVFSGSVKLTSRQSKEAVSSSQT